MQEISARQFVKRLKEDVTREQASRFAFFLGAGCSVSSGIPTASDLVRNHWLPRLMKYDHDTYNAKSLETWAQANFKGYTSGTAALFYGQVIERLFPGDENVHRQTEIARITDGKDPAFGYAVLANLINHPSFSLHCDVVLTTNFDDLVADALYLFSNKKPLVITHESLLGFVRNNRNRPLVIKLHGDARLEPKNTEKEVGRLKEAVHQALAKILAESALIFIGYGGNDRGILDALRSLPDGSLQWGVYWINESKPSQEMCTWLDAKPAFWVRHLDFDELMLSIWDEFGLAHPDLKRFEELLENYRKTFENLSEKVKGRKESEAKRDLQVSLDKAARKFDNWYSVHFEANKHWKTDREYAKAIYIDGLKQFPGNPSLLVWYAIFLNDVCNEIDEAEKCYKLALKAKSDPGLANTLGNYALFLKKRRKDYDQAEVFYKRAIKADPNYVNILGNYAVFLNYIRKDYDQAEAFYKRALEAGPKHANNLGNYAGFLLALGRIIEGTQYLEEAVKVAQEKSIKLECQFYKYAHINEQATRAKSLSQIKTWIDNGVRSPGWDLSGNVKQAIKDGHPEPDMLNTLAKAIADETSAKDLDKFKAWREA